MPGRGLLVIWRSFVRVSPGHLGAQGIQPPLPQGPVPARPFIGLGERLKAETVDPPSGYISRHTCAMPRQLDQMRALRRRSKPSMAVLLCPGLPPGSGHPCPALIRTRHTSVMSATPISPVSPVTGR